MTTEINFAILDMSRQMIWFVMMCVKLWTDWIIWITKITKIQFLTPILFDPCSSCTGCLLNEIVLPSSITMMTCSYIKMSVRYILSSVWVRLSIFSALSIIQYVGLCVFSLPISLVMIERIYILCLIIIIKSEVWTITHCLGLGHETMVSAVCLSIFLWKYFPRYWPFVRGIHRSPVNSPHKGQ